MFVHVVLSFVICVLAMQKSNKNSLELSSFEHVCTPAVSVGLRYLFCSESKRDNPSTWSLCFPFFCSEWSLYFALSVFLSVFVVHRFICFCPSFAMSFFRYSFSYLGLSFILSCCRYLFRPFFLGSFVRSVKPLFVPAFFRSFFISFCASLSCRVSL